MTQAHHTVEKIRVSAPAKVNLFLHVTGKQPDGYHTLDSLVAFADICDVIDIVPADRFSFTVMGPFSAMLGAVSKIHCSDGDNLVIRAAKSLADVAKKPMNVAISLTKNLPVSAGIGGGSADAAATIWGLQQLWGLPRDADYLAPLLRNLGADVPVCYRTQATYMRGIGDVLISAPDIPDIPIVLVNPLVPCATEDVFLTYDAPYKKDTPVLGGVQSIQDFIAYIAQHSNDLYAAACDVVPDVENILAALNAAKGCGLSRMSGSGATCFGLFSHESAAQSAAKMLQKDNPDWWVQSGMLSSVLRY